ncbi:MAG: hypothetical protein ABSA69_05470 [Verrucomicrobiota bacterium]
MSEHDQTSGQLPELHRRYGHIERMNTIKITSSLFAVSLLALTGCSTTHPAGDAKADSETVLVTYHVQSGKEAEFQAVLSRGWEVYQSEHLVFARPHIIVRDTEDTGKTRFVEVFTWVKSPDHAPDSVKAVWKQEQSLCEARSGHGGIEGGEVRLIIGR